MANAKQIMMSGDDIITRRERKMSGVPLILEADSWSFEELVVDGVKTLVLAYV